MTKREQMLVVLMAGALVGAVGMVLQPAAKAPARGPARDSARPGSLSNLYRQVQAEQLNPGERMVLERAVMVWTNSPMARIVKPPPPAPPEDVVSYRYTGFLLLGRNPLAIVNNREYRVGECVVPGDFTVVDIQADRVVLAATSGTERLTLLLEQLHKREGSP